VFNSLADPSRDGRELRVAVLEAVAWSPAR
jgi:hypothetical protein